MWKIAAAVVILGAVMVAFALSSDDGEWAGWTGLFFTIAGTASLAAKARTAAETAPAPASKPADPFRPEHPAEQEDEASPRPMPSPNQTRPARSGTPEPAVVASPGRATEPGVRRQQREPTRARTATDVPPIIEPDASVIELLAAVPGLGPSKQRALAIAFPTMEQLQDATVEDLTAIDRVGSKVAGRITSLSGATIDDLLGDIPGVGPSKRRALTDRFETAPRLMNATEDEIAAVERISPGMASRIRQSLDTRN